MGVILDLANFAREGEIAPVLAVSVLRDRIDCVHIGGTHWVDDGVDGAGCRKMRPEFCPLDESDLDATGWIAALVDAGLDVPLIIEDFGQYADGPGRLERSVAVLRRIAGTPNRA